MLAVEATANSTTNVKMAVVLRRFPHFQSVIRISELNKQNWIQLLKCSTSTTPYANKEEGTGDHPKEVDGFRVLRLYPKIRVEKRTKREVKPANPPRTLRMTPDQDWANVWPGPRTYHPSVVPLPLRMGCNKFGAPPDRFANTELMKIPNFLHLTPPAIKKHCDALRKFCTTWPEDLSNDKEIEKHFPVEVISSDYCHASCSIRDERSRIISLKIKLNNLEFDEHSKDKFLRLVGERYNAETDYVTITTDSCPLKKQNYDYAHYLLTALYFESWKTEEWEKKKSDDDMEVYIYSKRLCSKNVNDYFEYNKREVPNTKDHEEAVEGWVNSKDGSSVLQKYKVTVLELLSLPTYDSFN